MYEWWVILVCGYCTMSYVILPVAYVGYRRSFKPPNFVGSLQNRRSYGPRCGWTSALIKNVNNQFLLFISLQHWRWFYYRKALANFSLDNSYIFIFFLGIQKFISFIAVCLSIGWTDIGEYFYLSNNMGHLFHDKHRKTLSIACVLLMFIQKHGSSYFMICGCCMYFACALRVF